VELSESNLRKLDNPAASLQIRVQDGDVVEVPAHRATHDLLRSALPFRTFRWYYGQRHYSGSYWSATMSTHVIYESRLELSRLLMADFDQSVEFIVAQPFLIRSKVQGVVRRHIPDYLLLTDTDPVMVDVKPREQVSDTKVAKTFDWVQHVIESLGWRFEIASEQPAVLLDNVRFLAGYRRPQSINEPALRALRATQFDNVTFGDAVRNVDGAEPLVRAALLHMLWTQEVSTDLSKVLSSQSILNPRVGA
jgi:hypothetical protein